MKYRFISIMTMIALVMVSVAGCRKNDTEKEKGTIGRTLIENYFKENEKYVEPENMYYEKIYNVNDDICVSGYLFSEYSSEMKSGVYDPENDKVHEIKTDNIKIQDCYTGEKYYYFCYFDENGMKNIARYNKETLLFTDNTIVGQGATGFLADMTEDENGRLCLYMVNMRDDILSEIMYCVYDNAMNLVDNVNLLEKISTETGDIYHTLKVSEDGSVYIFLDKNDGTVNMYKFSSENELQYITEDVTGDMEGHFTQCIITKSGNPVISTYNHRATGSHHTCFNELVADTGEIIGRYDTNILEGYLQIVRADNFENYGDSDILFIQGGKICGYSMKYDEIYDILDFEKYSDTYGSLSVSAIENESLLFISNIVITDYSEGSGIVVTDKNGKEKFRFIIEGTGQIYSVTSDKDENIYMMYGKSWYDSEIGDITSQSYIDKFDKSWNRISSITLEDDYNWYDCTLIVHENGNITVSQDDNIKLFYSDGKMISSVNVAPDDMVKGIFAVDNEHYAVYTDVSGVNRLAKINYDKKSIEDISEIKFMITDVNAGDENYDAYFTAQDGIYGYKVHDNSISEVINWIDSDIDTQIADPVCFGKDTIGYVYYEENDYHISCLDRVDSQTLENINKKENIILACDTIPAYIKKKIVEYNRDNENYRIIVNDYNKYSGYHGNEYISGLSELNLELIEGNIPDIVLGNKNLDMRRYTQLGMFADLGGYLEKDGFTNDEEYFTNIMNTFGYDGKQYQVPLTFSLTALAGKESVIGQDYEFTFDEFWKLGETKTLFYKPFRENLIQHFISDNLLEYVDFKERKCNFESDDFIKLLGYIKENGIPIADYESVHYEDEDYPVRIIEEICCFDYININSFDVLARFKQMDVINKKKNPDDRPAFLNIPSAKGNGIRASSATLVSICEKSRYKDVAWDFIKSLFEDEAQKKLSLINGQFQYDFPIKKSVFESQAKSAMANTDNMHSSDHYGNDVKLRNIDSDTLEILRELIKNADTPVTCDQNISSIINEQCEIFFAGGQTAEETAKAIQSRATLYLQEIK